MANTLELGNGKWATGKDTVLAFNDENNNFKPLPFSFSRASSGTVVNKEGLIETVGSGEPRIDFKDNTKGALLLEPQRGNLVTYSEDTTEWDKNETPINTSNTTISPNGYRNADSVIVNSISEGFYDFSIGTVNSGASYTFSIFIKHISGIETIRFGGSGGGFGGDNNNVFNIKNGTVVSAVSGNTLSVNDYGNGWYRLIATKTASSTATAAWVLYGNENAEIQYSAWGVQVEQGSYATSYIPTSGSAVTRVADSTSQTVPDGVIGQTEGTIFVDVDFETLSGTNMFVSIRPDASNKIEIYRSDAIIYGEFSSNVPFNFNKPSVTVGRYKIAVAYSSGSSAMYINGVLIGSNTTPFAFTSTLDDVYINSRGTSFLEQSNYNDVKLYNTRLSNNELQALTTI